MPIFLLGLALNNSNYYAEQKIFTGQLVEEKNGFRTMSGYQQEYLVTPDQ